MKQFFSVQFLLSLVYLDILQITMNLLSIIYFQKSYFQKATMFKWNKPVFPNVANFDACLIVTDILYTILVLYVSVHGCIEFLEVLAVSSYTNYLKYDVFRFLWQNKYNWVLTSACRESYTIRRFHVKLKK